MLEGTDHNLRTTPAEPALQVLGWKLWRILLVGLVVVFLMWALITKQLAGYLALHAPETALAIDPEHPVALVTLADRLLNGVADADEPDPNATELPGDDAEGPLKQWAAQATSALTSDGGPTPRSTLTEANRARIEALAQKALARDPLNHRALRILGQLADARGDRDSARKFMQAAVKRSLRSTYAVYWLLVDSMNRHDDFAAAKYADLLLRKRPQLYSVTYPLLAQIAESEDQSGPEAVTSVLAANPPWRATFLRHLPEHVRDARTPFVLLRALKDGPFPPDDDEINAYLDFLVSKRLYEFAYYVWLQGLSAQGLSSVGFLVNGSFEHAPSGAPFDWSYSRGGLGVTIDIAQRLDADGERALYLDLGPGRTRFSGISQLVMLSPGRYRLSGRMQGDVSGKRGLQWQISCLPFKEPVGETQMFLGSAPQWTSFETEFEVPREDCRMQQLRLIHASRSASEELVSGAIWFDAMTLSRVTAGP